MQTDDFHAASDRVLRGLIEDREARIRELEAELLDARQEIARHHVDFAAWEDLAAKGAESLAERERLRADLKTYRESRTYWYVRYHEANAARTYMERQLVAALENRETLPEEAS